MVVASASPPLLSIILLVSSVRFSTGQPSSPSAITFLTYRPSLETIRFALQLAQDIPSVDVHVVVDDNNFSFLQPNSSLLRFLLFNETVCNQSDFHGSNIAGIKRACSAWDKALYFFARIALHYRFVWFIEDDVFIPSTRAFLAIHQLYSSTNDLVIPAVQYILDGNIRRWDHAHLLANEFPLPWLKGMVAGVGLSRRLLSAVDEHVRWRGHLPFIEFLFPILAFRDEQMKIVSPPELAKIVYRTSYSFEQILAAPNDWWHPVKIVDQRQQWRQELATYAALYRHNTSAVLLQSIEMQFNRTEATLSIFHRERAMLSLLTRFEIEKSRLDTATRQQLRHRFLRLQSNQSQKINKTAVMLANSAYKLSDNLTSVVFQQIKTEKHLKLERALKSTKQSVLELMAKKSLTGDEMILVQRLRKDTIRIIREQTDEIKCETKIIMCNRKSQPASVAKMEWKYVIKKDAESGSDHRMDVLVIVLSCVMFCFLKALYQTYRRLFK